MDDSQVLSPRCRRCGRLMTPAVITHRYYPLEVIAMTEVMQLPLDEVVQYECPNQLQHGFVWRIKLPSEGIFWVD
jgi:hypothetical protein